jgi:hypothetical protein
MRLPLWQPPRRGPVFIFGSRLPSHQIADRRVMQIQVRRYLLLSITVFLNGFNDFSIPLFLLQERL